MAMRAEQRPDNNTLFNAVTGKFYGSKPRRIHLDKSPAQREARLIQRIVVKRIKNDNPTVSELVSLVRAWDILEERIRILSGHGTPKPVNAVNVPSAYAPRQQWTDEKPDLNIT